MSNLWNLNDYLNIKGKVDDISNRLDVIKLQPHGLGLLQTLAVQQVTFQTEALRNQRESSSEVSQVFGRNDKKKEILEQLLKDYQGNEKYAYAMIPIVGKGGIGKTTLAQYAFNDEQVNRHFYCKAWVCVSDVFDVTRITTTILEEVSGRDSHVETSTLNKAQMKLRQALTGKKFLIVLDDIWNEQYDAWEKLQEPFKHAAKGSRVVMTTRNERIARLMNTNPIHDNIIKLKDLSDNDCWSVFKQHVNSNDSDIAEMQDEIINKCKGLPLAAKALGGLLKTTEGKRHRRLILDSNIWSEECNVLPVLRLSYHHLPSHLKRIFAYCSMFPKDYIFNELEVVLLWMAQGFLPDKEPQSMEDFGHKFFADLVSRSLFEPIHNYGEGMFVMHDLIHDLAQWAASGTFYAKGANKIAQVNRKRIRHVYLIEDATMQERKLIAPQVRTLYVDGTITNLDFIRNFCYIRALRLASNRIKVLPECIGDLKHLRFLSLSIERLKELPKSISKLWNLQTLFLEGSFILKEFPDIGSLKELRYLDISLLTLGKMPQGIGKLTNLKSLGEFILDDECGFRVRELKNLNNLQGTLWIRGVGNVTEVEDAKETQLHEKCGLDKLHLDWRTFNEEVDDNIDQGEVAEQLKPPTSIKEYELVGYMGLTLPGWLGDPCFYKMVGIMLSGCAKCERLPPLGQLLCLKRLEISGMDSIKHVGVEFYGCSNPFPVLKYLHFEDMKSWEKWEHIPSNDDNNAFPCLETLKIINCHSLKTLEMYECQVQSVAQSECYKPHLPLPALKHLESLLSEMHKCTSLQYLHIKECPKLQCFPEGGLPENLKSIDIVNVGVVEWGLHRFHSLEVLHLDSIVITQEENFNLSLSSSSLRKIVIQDLQNLKNLSVVNGTNLKTLEMGNCLNLESLDGNFTSLELLSLIDCPKLQSLSPLISTAIQVINLTNLGSCTDAIERIPGVDLDLPSLRDLSVSDLKNLSVVNATNLNKLEIRNCTNLESLVGNFNSLESLLLENSPKLHSLPPLVSTSIRILELCNLGSITDAIEQIPGPDLHLPSSLSLLDIEGVQNLKTISCSTLPNLTDLWIKSCPRFESFGDTALPPQLQEVYIRECEMIMPRLQSDPHNGIIRMDDNRYSLC